MTAIRPLLLLCGVVVAMPAQANVCGSDVSKYLVPDYICVDAQGSKALYQNCDVRKSSGTLARHKVNLTSACARHDACYGTRGARKSGCDTTFYGDLNSACRAKLGANAPEPLRRACHEAALVYNDVVRGQATKRYGLWMGQQVPFTGDSGCSAFLKAQRRAGVSNAQCD